MKCSLQRPVNNNKTLPTRLSPMEGQQKEIKYPGWHNGTTGKELWSGENDEVFEGNRDVWGDIKWGIVISDFDTSKLNNK